MKTFIKLITVLVAIATLVFFVGCEKNGPVSSDQNNDSGITWISFNKGKIGGGVGNGYPQTTSEEFTWNEYLNCYRGGNLSFLNGTKLVVPFASLTPPAGTPTGDPILITGLIEMDTLNNELIFTFGPCGSGFTPAADIFMKYGDLGNGNPTLYYIDANGNYIEQEPHSIDRHQKWMQVEIQHFSRYAIAISR